MVTKTTERYYSVTETAVLIRTALKKQFPGVEFSVKSKKYAGGASIDVHWNFGPIQEKVNDILSMYSGKGFDAMTDYAYYKSHWMLPDGTITLRRVEQTASSHEVDNPPPPGAVAVSFGSDYVHGRRNYGKTFEESEEFSGKVGQDLCKLQGVEWKGLNDTNHLFGSNDSNYIGHWIYQLVSNTSFDNGEEYAGVRYITSEERENREDKSGMGIVMVKTVPPPAPVNNNVPAPATATGKMSVNYNARKNGIELHFSEKPSDAVLIKLKINNFRWSKFSQCWYQHDTPDVRDFINNTDWGSI